MLKLVVCDFDGTLMPYGTQALSQGVKNRMLSLIEKNITVAVSSGRTYSELIEFLPEFKDLIYFICCDGAYYIKNGKPLYEKHITNETLSHFFNNTNSAFVFHTAFGNYSFGSLPVAAEHFKAAPINSVGEINEKIFKVTGYGNNTKPNRSLPLRVHWDGGINSSTQYVNQFANKGTALSDLQMRLMISKFDTACIGDSNNDIAMMRNAKYTFAVGNRCNELLAVVNNNVDSIESALDYCLNLSQNNINQHYDYKKPK